MAINVFEGSEPLFELPPGEVDRLEWRDRPMKLKFNGNSYEWLSAPTPAELLRDKLSSINFSIRDIGLDYAPSINGGGAGLTPSCRVQPRKAPGDFTIIGETHLHGITAIVDEKDPALTIRRAKLTIMALLEHEVDEMFFKAGLGPDPHATPISNELLTQLGVPAR